MIGITKKQTTARNDKALQPVTAYVVYSNDTNLPWLRLLKKGFRHCALIMRKSDTPAVWLVVDPLSHHLVIDEVVATAQNEDLPAQLRRAGHTLQAVTSADAPRKTAPFLPLTCVEVIKRLLGIHSWRVHTPYQLYRYLQKKAV